MYKQKGFTFIENLLDWLNTHTHIEDWHIITTNGYILIYFEPEPLLQQKEIIPENG